MSVLLFLYLANLFGSFLSFTGHTTLFSLIPPSCILACVCTRFVSICLTVPGVCVCLEVKVDVVVLLVEKRAALGRFTGI